VFIPKGGRRLLVEMPLTRPPEFRLSLVVPAYNEAENVLVLADRLASAARDYPDAEIVVVDDGSSDGTLERLRLAAIRHPRLRYVSLSRNFGHQAARRAGLAEATGDCVICLDADLQHPPELIGEMVARWREGADVVSCLRQDQVSLPLFKRVTSRWFYKLLNGLSGLELVAGSSDFRLLDRKVLDVLVRLPESDLFYRGLIPTLGFRTATIAYVPDERLHGTSKYTLRKMVRLALNGVISTSMRPLRLAIGFAFVTALSAFAFLAYVLYVAMVTRSGVPGWASMVGVTLVIGTMQLLVLGVIGEYLGQVLKETRRRPPYHIAEASGDTARSAGEPTLSMTDRSQAA